MTTTVCVPRTVVLGSTSPAKLKAVESALRELQPLPEGEPFELTAVNAASGVPNQPWGEPETRQGALNRAIAALKMQPAAQLAVGIEAGVADEPGWPLWAFAWVVALDRSGKRGAARSAAFAVPGDLAEGVRKGMELGHALDALYGITRAKDGPGAVGVLTAGLVHRPDLYRQAVLLSLMPWLAPVQRPPAQRRSAAAR